MRWLILVGAIAMAGCASTPACQPGATSEVLVAAAGVMPAASAGMAALCVTKTP